MADTLDPLILDLVEWVAAEPAAAHSPGAKRLGEGWGGGSAGLKRFRAKRTQQPRRMADQCCEGVPNQKSPQSGWD